jgi:hypothetical protein
MELAALPGSGTEHGAAGGTQTGMIVGDDELHTAHAACDQVVEEATPVDLGLRQGDADAEHPSPFVGADTDCREDGCVAHDASCAHLLVAGVEDQVADLTERAIAPCLQLLIEQGCGAADLG